MRAYTLSVLSRLANTGSPIIEKEIVGWVNKKLENAGKATSLRSFQDSAIADGRIVIDLVDSIKPGSVNYDLVKSNGTEEVRLKTEDDYSNIVGDDLTQTISILFIC